VCQNDECRALYFPESLGDFAQFFRARPSGGPSLRTGYQPWHLFHHLWTKAVGTDGYIKQEWCDLEALLVRAKIAIDGGQPAEGGAAQEPPELKAFAKDRHWDIFTADDGGRLLRLCCTNDAGNFMAMEVAEFVTWNSAAEQREAEETMLQMLNIAEKNRAWLRKKADGEDKNFLAAGENL
jgi:hypothetical protein